MKEVSWSEIYGEGTIVSNCDQCSSCEEYEFEDGYPDYKSAQAELRDIGWTSTKVNGEWCDFCSEECRNQYIKDNA